MQGLFLFQTTVKIHDGAIWIEQAVYQTTVEDQIIVQKINLEAF